MILRIVDGTTTVNFVGVSTMKGVVYFPKTATRDDNGAWQPVTEEATVLIESTPSDVLVTTHALEILFGEARDRQETGVGPRVYVEYAVSTGAANRAEIYDGAVHWSGNRQERMLNQDPAFVVVTVTWTRCHLWEGQRTQIPVSNVNGTNNTGGLQISNYGDNRHRHVEFDAAGAATIEPCPLEIRLKNTVGSLRNVRDLHLFTQNFDVSASLTVQGEARQASYGSTVANSTASNGQYLNLSINGVQAIPWTISAANLSKLAGRYCRILAKFFHYDNAANIYITPSIKDEENLVVIARAGRAKLDNRGPNYFQDLGELPFPPGGYNTNWDDQVLALEFRTESSQTINLDFLLLVPVDAYMPIVQIGNTVDAGEEIVIDGIEEQVYCTRGGANHPLYAPKSDFLHIWPGKPWLDNHQRIYIAVDGTDVVLADTWDVKLFYRPRRLTV